MSRCENQHLFNKGGLLAIVLAVFIFGCDFTIFAAILPVLSREFSLDVTDTQWIFNGYALTIGVLIITGGRLADLYGRKRVLLIGFSLFIFFSILGGFSGSVWGLIVCRALMGIGVALSWPALLGMLYSIIPRKNAGIAGGILAGVGSLGNAMGPLIGAAITDFGSWRWVMWVNVPFSLFVMVLLWRYIVKEVYCEATFTIHYINVFILSFSLFCLLLGLDLAVDLGFNHVFILGLFSAFIVSLYGFRRLDFNLDNNALIPHYITKNKQFMLICLLAALVSTQFFSLLLYLPQFFSQQWHYSAIQSSVGILPIILTCVLFAFIGGVLLGYIGRLWVMRVSIVVILLGVGLLSRISASSDKEVLFIGMMLFGAGLGLFNPSITTQAMTLVNPESMSLAGGILYMFRIAGGAIGLAVNTSIIASSASLLQGIQFAFLFNLFLSVLCLILMMGFIHSKGTATIVN
ncbi:MFS transporter [Shewanella surugensis]|uniref:MFS transporter n=1 Tax=Shewanella surugensis TaxID=212020 RepID=A0ABT0LEZ7_9GAMM|nr:MFS transporter [Shewanella surugensis]MCL1126277.1 MFS transporter [Shewanella surugensis]